MPIEIVCHRGANEIAPENTYPAAQQCIDWGMDTIEIDVNSSADGVLYVLHGPSLEKTTNGRGIITNQPSTYLDTLDAGSWFSPQFAGEPIPRLAEFLPWVKGRARLFLDIKWCHLPTLVALIRDHQFEVDAFFWFERPEFAAQFRQLAPEMRLKVNANSAAEVAAAVEQFQADIIEADYPVHPEVVAACQKHDVKLMIYYRGADEAIFADIVRQQPDMVNVNYGDRFARVMRAMGSG